jgi:hypothetical protein
MKMENHNPTICNRIEDRLIDYADNQLAADISVQITDHLAHCRNCRQKLNALKKSLALTQSIWQQNLSQIQDIEIPAARKSRPKLILPAAAAAAAIIITAGLFLIPGTPTAPIEEISPQVIMAQIERQINHAGIAAKHLAAAQQLKEYPDGETMVQNQYRYIVKSYPNTTAAEKAKLLIK